MARLVLGQSVRNAMVTQYPTNIQLELVGVILHYKTTSRLASERDGRGTVDRGTKS